MTEDERRELIAAVHEALGPFKDELKKELTAELQSQVLEPMESRLSGWMDNLEIGMGEMEKRLSGRMDNLETEIISLTNEVVSPFIQAVYVQQEALVEQLDRLERQVDRNRTRIEQVHTRVEHQERLLFSVADDIALMRKQLSSIERRLGGGVMYDITQAEFVVAGERSVYEMLHELEERVTRLEEGTK